MLKRLLTAVLVLGLILAFSGTAFTNPDNVPRPERDRISLPTGTHHGLMRVEPAAKAAPDQVQMGSAGVIPPRPGMQAVDTNACYEQDYYSDATGASYVVLVTGAGAPSMSQMGSKFDVFKYPTHKAVLSQMYTYIYTASHLGGAGVNLRVRVWTEAAGMPSTTVWAGNFSLPYLAAPGGWVSLTLPNIEVAGPTYYVSIGQDSAAVAGDTIAVLFGNNPSARGRWRSGNPASWKLMATVFGTDYDPAIVVDQCEHYTSCYSELGFPGGSVWLVQSPDNADWGTDVQNGFGQRFVSTGRETITGVDVFHYDYSGTLPGYFYTSTSTNGWTIQLWNDDGAGNIDNTAGPFYTETVAGGTALFPATGLAADGWNSIHVNFTTPQVVDGGPWHVTVKASSDDPNDGSFLFAINKETVNPGWSGGSIGFTTTTPYWTRMYLSALWGNIENAFFIRTYRCKDEFSLCQNQVLYDAPASYAYTMRPAGLLKWAQIVKGKDVNRVQKIRFQITLKGAAPQAVVKIWSWTASGPGTELWSTTVAPTFYPGWTEVVIPGGLQIASNQFFVGYENDPANASGDTLRAMTEDVDSDPAGHAHEMINGGAWINYGGTWYSIYDAFGYTDNMIMEVEFCSIPPSIWTCGTAADPRTEAYDYGRTSHSNVAMSDAYCDLTLNWAYAESPLGYANTTGQSAAPIVMDTFVIHCFGAKYRILDLRDGSIIGTITSHVNPNGGVQATPTIATVTIGGTPKPILFLAGGNTPQRTFSAYDMSTFTGTKPDAVPTEVWSINDGTYAALGYDDPDIPLGNTNFTNPVVLTVGGVPMVFFATDDLWLFGANATTGAKVWQLAIPGYTNKGLCSDGAYLYCSVMSIAGYFDEGDILKVNPQTGVIVNQLSAAGGLQGTTMYPSNSIENEGFSSGLSYYDGQLYAISTFLNWTYSPTPAPDGIFYRIKTSDMSVLSTTASMHLYTGGALVGQGFPMVDETQVICATRSAWGTPTQAGSLIAYNRYSGAMNYAAKTGTQVSTYSHRADGVLTCEADATHNLAFITNSAGYLSCVDVNGGTELFSRRWDNTAAGVTNTGSGVALAKDGSLLVATFAGQLFCLTKQADRPRLSVPSFSLIGNTYGPLPSVTVTFPTFLQNTGCATLTGTVSLWDASNGVALGSARQDGSSRYESIADQLTTGSASFVKGNMLDPIRDEFASTSTRPMVNNAAAALPVFINAPGTYTFSVAPGGTFDLPLDVNQSMIKRGPNTCYARIESNDPDYFLNNVALIPQVYINIIGGCLTDTTTLHFGASNVQWVHNNGRLGTSKDCFSIETNNADMYGGFYVYGVSRYRIAMNGSDWWSNSTLEYTSLQGDPNDCNTNCKPALTTGLTLGQIWNGTTYTNLMGSVVCRNYLDSVQMWQSGSRPWNWNGSTGGPTFNNDSTMGLMVSSRVFGFTTVPTGYEYLNNVTVDIMKIYSRNNTALPNWRMGEFIDYDLGGDTAHYDAGISAAWSVPTARATGAWGAIKLPFGGCGTSAVPPMRNAKALAPNQAMNYQPTSDTVTCHGNGYLDSVYSFMGLGQNGWTQGNVSAQSDQQFHATFAAHNFVVGDTFIYAVAQFGFPTVANPKNASNYAALAKTLNAWIGYGRGDVNNDGLVNLADIVYLADYINGGGPGPMPFKHVGDVNADGLYTSADYQYLIDYYFHYGPCPVGKIILY